ncbi:MAG: hypothetical protein ACLRZ6_12415 [Lachnospiraceae bacterium]
MRRKKEPHENKRRGLSLKPLIIGMSACVVLLGGVLLWAVLGSVRLEPESGHGLGIVDAVNTMGLQKDTGTGSKAIGSIIRKPDTYSEWKQMLKKLMKQKIKG